MKNIEVKILNPEVIQESEKMMVCGARLTQRGHGIKNMDDFMELYNKSYQQKTADVMYKLPHPTIQKLGVINIVVVGASRRFLAQITRHQNEVKFVSASLQYSDYSNDSNFVVPYDILEKGRFSVLEYLRTCEDAMMEYSFMVRHGIDNDAAGYMAPQGLRNVLIISATPYQWKHMIKQRACRRNTKETEFVMLKIWEELYKINPAMFAGIVTGPGCMGKGCPEGKMCCGKPIRKDMTPTEILREDFPLIFGDQLISCGETEQVEEEGKHL